MNCGPSEMYVDGPSFPPTACFSMSLQHSCSCVFLCLLCLVSRSAAEEWPQFRGTNSAGVSLGVAPPIEFGPGKNELWVTPLASGHSSPCIVGDSIYLTTYESDKKQLAVVRIHRPTGSVAWSRPIETEEIETGHPSFNPASSTPASDGERVVAYFGSYGLICFNKDGEQLWDVKMPLAKSYAGNATSPTIVDDKVILYRGNNVGHFLLAVDKRTGEELWKSPQPEKFASNMACTATPVFAQNQIIIHGIRTVRSFDIDTGRQLWMSNCFTTGTSTPVIVGDEVLVATWNQTGETSLVPAHPPFGTFVAENDQDKDGKVDQSEFPKLMRFHRSEGTEAPENGWPVRFRDLDKDRDGFVGPDEWQSLRDDTAGRRARMVLHGLVAISLESKGEVTQSQVRTLEQQGIPEVPSPVAHEGLIYFVKNGGIITCIDIESGKKFYKRRTGAKGTHYASPIIAGGRLYSTGGDGTITVMTTGKRTKILAKNKMGERTYATPAVVDGVIYVRTHKHLYAFAAE